MVLLVAVAMYVATNIDDFVLLTLFFALADRDWRQKQQIVTGQFLGIGVLVLISLSLWVTLIFPVWVFLISVLILLNPAKENMSLENPQP